MTSCVLVRRTAFDSGSSLDAQDLLLSAGGALFHGHLLKYNNYFWHSQPIFKIDECTSAEEEQS